MKHLNVPEMGNHRRRTVIILAVANYVIWSYALWGFVR